MLPIMFGIAMALGFDALAVATYGSAALTDYVWVQMVTWGLIGGGVAVHAMTRPMPLWLCGLVSRAKVWLQGLSGVGTLHVPRV